MLDNKWRIFPAASTLIRMMLTVSSEKRANIADICSHNWVNDGYGDKSCLNEAEYLASLTPVRLDLLLSLVPPGNLLEEAAKEAIVVGDAKTEEKVSCSDKIDTFFNGKIEAGLESFSARKIHKNLTKTC